MPGFFNTRRPLISKLAQSLLDNEESRTIFKDAIFKQKGDRRTFKVHGKTYKLERVSKIGK